VLIGILLFFVAREIGALAHCHEDSATCTPPGMARAITAAIATMVIIGDTFHKLRGRSDHRRRVSRER